MTDERGTVTSHPTTQSVSRTDLDLARKFHALFAGSESAYGTYLNIDWDNAREDGKFKGDAETVSETVTNELWAAHLAGSTSIGIIPVRKDGTCFFGAIDIDSYQDFDSSELAIKVAAMKLPLVPCRSKSGGCHLYLFSKERVPAQNVRQRLRDIAVSLDHPKAEVFPKQDVVLKGDKGSWINVPYQNMVRTVRYGIAPNGGIMTPEEFLALAEAIKVDAAWFDAPLSLANTPGAKGAAKKTRNGKNSVERQGFMLPDVISEGERNNTFIRYAGCLRRCGMDEDGILAALRHENEARCTPPLDDKELRSMARSMAQKEPGSESNDGLIQTLAKTIIATDHFARDNGEMLYHFEGGVYRPTGKRLVAERVKRLCAQECPKSWTPELARNVREWILADAPTLWESPALDIVNCRNGLLDVKTRTLRPHDPSYLSGVQIGAIFDPGARCQSVDKFISDVFPDDTRPLAYEVAAWLMLPDTNIQKAILTLGEGANGKSAWLNLLLNFLGRDNVSTISLHRLESDKFAMARLLNKLANIGSDLPTAALASTSAFKALVGNDVVTAERKFESSFEFHPFARLLFSANSAPRSDDATHGFFRRWLVIPFNRTFNESSQDTVPRAVLDARLSEAGELSGLLNRALDALPAIQAGRFTESASTRAALDEFRRNTDPFSVWLEQNTVDGGDAWVTKEALRAKYGSVCQEAGRPIMADAQFTAALKRLRPKVETAQRRINGQPTRVFVGIGLGPVWGNGDLSQEKMF